MSTLEIPIPMATPPTLRSGRAGSGGGPLDRASDRMLQTDQALAQAGGQVQLFRPVFPEGDGGDAARFVQEDAAAKLPVDHRRPGDVILFPKRDGGCGGRGLPGWRERLRPGHGPVSGRDGAQKLAREGGARGWLSEPGGIGEQLKLVFGPGDPDVEQPPLLL